jgi:S1-C subfamily serine protease
MSFRPVGRLAPWLLVIAALAHGSARSQPSSSSAELFNDVRDGLMMVGHGRRVADGALAVSWLGTGFLVDRNCVGATAKHILEGVERENLVIRLRNPEDRERVLTLPASVLFEDPKKDLAFLRIAELPGSRRCPLSGIRPVELAESLDPDRLTGAAVLLAGYPVLEGEQPRDVAILRHGYIASAELEWEGQPMLLLDLTGVPGFSGAPVIERGSGEVIGVVFGPGRTQRQYDLDWATPISGDDYSRATARRKKE